MSAKSREFILKKLFLKLVFKKKQYYTKKVQGPSNTPGSEPPSVNSPGVDPPSNEPSDQYSAHASIGDSLANLLDQNVFFS